MILVNFLLIFNRHIGLGKTVNDRSIDSESFISKKSELIEHQQNLFSVFTMSAQ